MSILRIVPIHFSMFRLLILLVTFVCGCTLWLVNQGTSTLLSNLSLVDMLDTLVRLPPPQPDEMLGLRPRAPLLQLGDNQDPGTKLDMIQPFRLRGAILALTGQPAAAESVLTADVAKDVLAQFWLAFAYGQQHKSDATLQILRSLPGIDEYFAHAGFREQLLGHYEQATQFLEAAATLDRSTISERSLIYETLTKNAYNHLGDWDTAVRWAERWIEAVPDNTNAYTWLAALYLWCNQPEKAYRVLRQAEKYGVKSNRFYPGQMGQIYQSRGRWDLAIQAYEESWARNKDDPTVLPFVAWNLGFALYHEGRWKEARPYLEMVQRIGSPLLQRQAADILAKMDPENVP